MNNNHVITGIIAGILTGILAGVLQGQQAKVAFRDAATNDSLSARYRQASLADPMKAMPQTQGEDPSVVNRVGNLLDESDLITFNGQTTLVPKKALVLVPQKISARINNHQSGSAVVTWVDFFSQNRGWISTVEVTFAQAKGDEPVSPEILEALAKSGNLVVAVFKNSPISVMPLKAVTPEKTIQTASQKTQP